MKKSDDGQPPKDENQIIAERRAKLAELRASGSPFPNDFRREHLAGDLHRALRRADQGGAGAEGRARRGRRPDDAEARHGQGELRDPPGHDRADPGVRLQRRDRRGSARGVQALGSRRHPRRRRHALQDPHRRADGQCSARPPPRQGAAAAAREVSRPRRPGAEVPEPLSRPDHERGGAPHVRGPQPPDPGDPRVHDRPGLPRGRDADDAADPGRRRGAAVRDASQRARHDALSPDRARAVSEAAGRRRVREGLRDQPQLPERGHLDAPQPRVHDARVLRGLPGLPVPHGLQRGAAPRGGAGGPRHDLDPVRRAHGRPRPAVRAADDHRSDAQAPSALHRSRSREPRRPRARADEARDRAASRRRTGRAAVDASSRKPPSSC